MTWIMKLSKNIQRRGGIFDGKKIRRIGTLKERLRGTRSWEMEG